MFIRFNLAIIEELFVKWVYFWIRIAGEMVTFSLANLESEVGSLCC